MQATAKDLRFHSTDLLNTVKRGEEVIISYHGKSCAKLIPIEEKNDNIFIENELFGLWSDNPKSQDVTKYIENSRQNRFHDN